MERFASTLEDRLFIKVDEVSMSRLDVSERRHAMPNPDQAQPFAPGCAWGEERAWLWLFGEYTPPETLAGRTLYIYPKTTCNEGMLWVDGEPFGIFTSKKPRDASRGNHYCDLLSIKAEPGKSLAIALEYYAGHPNPGTMPLVTEHPNYKYLIGPTDICLKDELISDFLFDLLTVCGLIDALDERSFRRADAINALSQVHSIVLVDPDNADEEEFRQSLKIAHPALKEILSSKNSASAPFAGLIGHSHMDTAWLWPVEETIKKCARTYANQLALMEQYPEYLFIQSSAFHSDAMRLNYPGLFERIKEKVLEGRYEPNGGIWVECDCNLVSGESLARQFIWGQRFTRRHFSYTADVFWLPDTFGYSAAIPQIMKLAGVKYFLTTKMSWNDTNRFPYDTFVWQGIDSTKVLAHLNQSHLWPTPQNLQEYVVSGEISGSCVREKTVSRQRLLSFGYGDGGGGPQFQMLEMARRLEDLDGLPRSGYRTASEFMQELETQLKEPSIYFGELYLELHRGTLTNQHQIKRNNRLSEIALHDLEYAAVRDAASKGKACSSDNIRDLTQILLVNQFHDILPGTCIEEVHELSLKETSALIIEARERTRALLEGENHGLSLTNTLSFSRSDPVYLPLGGYNLPEGALAQETDTLFGPKLAVGGLKLEPLSSLIIGEGNTAISPQNPFKYENSVLETPFATITFDENGFISSFLDKTSYNRELRGEGFPLGTYLVAEDVPLIYDNWDIDADIERKLEPKAKLISRETVSCGAVEFRIRSLYQLTPESSLQQDFIAYADSPLVRFELMIDWQNHHRLLKVAFDTSIKAQDARFEIQFGHIKRATHRNTDIEKAKFEVCNHKYTDLSESQYGAAILNDCKYGISVRDGQMRLTLHKGGNRPDIKGDLGRHFMSFGFLPHSCGFSSASVVHAAYEFNYPVLCHKGGCASPPLADAGNPAVIIESVKPPEDSANAFILRMYESEGSTAHAEINVFCAKRITPVNLLEEPCGESICGDIAVLNFRPFEIKTLLVDY
jgi:alpha-mannosidase